VGGNKVGDFLESDNRFQTQAIVLALPVHFAYMKLSDPVAETPAEPVRFEDA